MRSGSPDGENDLVASTGTVAVAAASDPAALSALVQRAQSGDAEATSTLLGQLRPVLLRYSMARLACRELAEDVTQEVLMALLASLPRFRGEGGGVLAFAFGVASHKVADQHRARARERAFSSATVPDQPDEADGPEQAVLRADAAEQVRARLARLPAGQRDVLLLRLSGLSAQETAAALGTTPGAVRVAAHRALATLRRREQR